MGRKAKAARVPACEPVSTFACVHRDNPRILPSYLGPSDGWWTWGVYIPVIVADARHYTVVPKKPAPRKKRKVRK